MMMDGKGGVWIQSVGQPVYFESRVARPETEHARRASRVEPNVSPNQAVHHAARVDNMTISLSIDHVTETAADRGLQ